MRVSVPITTAAGAGSASTNTPGLTGLTKDVGDAIVDEAGCAVITKYPTVPLPRFQCTDAVHAFRNPFTSVMYVCVGTPYSGAIGNDMMIKTSTCQHSWSIEFIIMGL